MINLNFYNSESTIRPPLVDNETSSIFTYIRKDVKEKVKNDVNGNSVTYYEYQEAKLTKTEYNEYLLNQQRADIDYIALISGVELEG